jgi:hypothetical protein
MAQKIITLQLKDSLANQYQSQIQRQLTTIFPKLASFIYEELQPQDIYIQTIPIEINQPLTHETFDATITQAVQQSIELCKQNPTRAIETLFAQNLKLQYELAQIPKYTQTTQSYEPCHTIQKIIRELVEPKNKPKPNYLPDTRTIYNQAQYLSTAIAIAPLRKQLRANDLIQRAIDVANNSPLSEAFWEQYKRNGTLHHFPLRAQSIEEAADKFNTYHHQVNRFSEKGGCIIDDWQNTSIPPLSQIDIITIYTSAPIDSAQTKLETSVDFKTIVCDESFTPIYEPIEYTEVIPPHGAQHLFTYKTKRGRLFYSPLDLRIESISLALKKLEKQTM